MSNLIGLLDGDIILYRICPTADPEAELYVIKKHVDTYMNSLLTRVGCSYYIGILGIHGSVNAKYDIFPEYKKGRPRDKPPHWNTVINYLVTKWQFVTVSGCETDDAIKFCMEESPEGTDTIVVSSDKDLLQIPGQHFTMGISRKGKIIREDKKTIITLNEAERNFYKQMLTGDLVDNVKACPGIGKVTAEKLLPEGIEPGAARLITISQYVKSYGEEWQSKFAINETLLRVNGDYARAVGFEFPNPVYYTNEQIQYY